ncbi:MAG: hypothetical protein AAF551_15080, partial [Bacteroidota bacterium]
MEPDLPVAQSSTSYSQLSDERITVPKCFSEKCKMRSGLFEIWPETEIVRALSAMDRQCLETMCGESSD